MTRLVKVVTFALDLLYVGLYFTALFVPIALIVLALAAPHLWAGA